MTNREKEGLLRQTLSFLAKKGYLKSLFETLLSTEQALELQSFLETAYVYHYPKADHTVDLVALGGTKILLIRRGNPQEPFYGHWALPGGFLDPKESLEEAAKRELFEETGIEGSTLMQLRTFSDPDRDPRGRVLSTVFLTLVAGTPKPKAGDDAGEARWIEVSEIPYDNLAFDHAQIIKAALAYLDKFYSRPHFRLFGLS